ncbi:hypothetical protein KDK95_08540 [Actinospica sp. MGRD01-02]|uniref:Uncharacterized protein n=1 Tax=Actinospica acidithermotolerans TaxID=2828514 RepID=A0A941IK38_9ACTN|nr:hypothetical protein [Actinospica acidithermotolerans]MBR7826346.1 hypothetical protein [Actinospica acidithermotolerans]
MMAGSRGSALVRALMYGAWNGAVIGGPVIGGLCLMFAVIGGPRVLLVALAVTVIGGVVGGLVGLVSAVLPGVVLASARGYLRRHMRVAAIVAAAISGVEVDSAFVIGRGGLSAATGTAGGVAFLCFAFVLFAIVGAGGPNHVIGDRKLMRRCRCLDLLRRNCPCRRFRLDAAPAA